MSAAYDRRRAEQIAHLQTSLPSLSARLSWSREQLAEHRTRALREVLAHAREHSAWHRGRMAPLDPERCTIEHLRDLPPMTKDDLMANWDEIVTDRRLTLAECEAHLARLSETPEYLLDEYHVIASGGSSGKRGVFVYGWDEWTTFYGAVIRWAAHAFAVNPGATGPLEGASIGGNAPTHATVALGMTFGAGGGPRGGQPSGGQPADDAPRSSFPVWLPVEEIVAGLNARQPTMVTTYTSMVKVLAAETEAGRLDIHPEWFIVSSEPLLPEIAELIDRVWGARVMNQYGTSDVGMMGSGCALSPGVHLNEDLLIVEPVNANGDPVGAGETAAKLFVTSLYHRTLPMIRYELTDEVTPVDEPCPCGCAFARVIDPQGRLDDLFRYGEDVIHPHLFRSPLSRCREIVEYQVRQTARGAEIDLVTSGALDLVALRTQLREALAGAGIREPQVELRTVDQIGRIGIGKLKRFVPLA